MIVMIKTKHTVKVVGKLYIAKPFLRRTLI